MGLIDSHAHLTDENLLDDVPGVLERARAAGVDHVVTIAQSVADAGIAIDLAGSREGVSATAGIHPHEAAKVTEADWPVLTRLLSAPEVVACGELGLDYHYDFADRDTQRAVLGRQLDLARGTGLPLVVHCRKAFADLIPMLLDHGFEGAPAVIHCFSGTAAEAEHVARHGWHISFTGVVTYKSAREIQGIARDYPAEKLMIETDCPYLAPVPKRGVFPNEPALLVHTAEFLATLRGESLEGLIAQTAANTREFFNLA